MSEALNLIGTQVIVRLESSNHCGYLLSLDPRSSTAFLIIQESLRVIHGHCINSIEPDIYCDPLSETTRNFINSFNIPVFAYTQPDIISKLMHFLKSKGIEHVLKDDVLLICNGFVKITYPYYKSCVVSNNKELLNQYGLLLDEFYKSFNF
jgi:hypothetical protein